MPTDAAPTLSPMRVIYSGEPQIFPDLGPWELVSGNVVDVPAGLEDSFMQRPDFAKADAKAKLSKLELPLGAPVIEDEPADEAEPEPPAPEPEAPSVQGADVIEEASAGTH